jgi:hypothetical protein
MNTKVRSNRVVIEFYDDENGMVKKFKTMCYPVPLQVIGRTLVKLFVDQPWIRAEVHEVLNRRKGGKK